MSARTAVATSVLLGIAAFGCAPSQSTFARPPAGAQTFDRAASDAKAVEIADRTIAASGGAAAWAAAKQLKWSETVEGGAKPIKFEEAWDRWNGRHYGSLHTDNGDIVAMHKIYEPGGTAMIGGSRLPGEQTEAALSSARDRFAFDSAILFMAFLLEEPGSKLSLVGDFNEPGQPTSDELKVTFDPKDPRNSTFFVMVNRTTNLVERIEIVKAGDPDNKRLGYKVTAVASAGALKVPAGVQNIGMTSEVIKFANVTPSAEPDETLYVPSVQ